MTDTQLTSKTTPRLDTQLSLLSGQDFWCTHADPPSSIPSVLLADGPHGLRVQGSAGDHLGLNTSTPATCFPPAVTLASSWDPGLVRDVGAALGREARALGVGLLLGPGLNIKRHPLCGRNFEYYSEDPLISGRLAAAAVEGIQSTGVGACLKHFAVNNQEHLRFVTDAVVDERTRREIYLRGFELAVRESRPRAVMAAYNRVNGVHCTDDAELLTGILRDEWGFDGVVVSDWGAVADRVAAVQAGMDLEMPGGLDRSGELRTAIEAGALSIEAVSASAERVIHLARNVPEQQGSIEALVDAHDGLSRRAAAASSVVLTNDGILPLCFDQRVAVIGAFAEHPRYQGSGSSLVVPTRVTTVLDGFRAAGLDVVYAVGYDHRHSAADEGLIVEAAGVAASADVAIVMVGLPGLYESEGFDRTTLELPAQHDALVQAVAAANPRTVVVLSNGAPVLMPWVSDVAAILECYLGGQASGGAVVDALLGVTEPSGRLAETFPYAQADIAADPYFPGDGKQVQYREGLYVGYRYTATAQIPSLFPFGHGLGYGATQWTSAAVDRNQADVIDTVTVSMDIENVGTRPTSEVVQVYARDLTGVVQRPVRELVGFARVLLAPGEHRRVSIAVEARALAFWDVRENAWRVPSGAFEFDIARSSERVEATVGVTVHGEVQDSAEPPTGGLVAHTDEAFAHRLGRPIPPSTPVRPFTRESTVGELSTTIVGRLLRAVMKRAANLPKETRDDPATMAMIERSMSEMPLRGLVQFSGGRSSWVFIDVVIDLANRRPRLAIKRVVRSRARTGVTSSESG
jgi:beta-glucosidase